MSEKPHSERTLLQEAGPIIIDLRTNETMNHVVKPPMKINIPDPESWLRFTVSARLMMVSEDLRECFVGIPNGLRSQAWWALLEDVQKHNPQVMLKIESKNIHDMEHSRETISLDDDEDEDEGDTDLDLGDDEARVDGDSPTVDLPVRQSRLARAVRIAAFILLAGAALMTKGCDTQSQGPSTASQGRP